MVQFCGIFKRPPLTLSPSVLLLWVNHTRSSHFATILFRTEDGVKFISVMSILTGYVFVFSFFKCHVLCISVSAHASVCDRLFTFTPFWSVREWAYLCVCANARTGVCVSVSSLPKTKLSRRGLQFCPVTLSTTLMQKKLLKSHVQLSKPSSYTL